MTLREKEATMTLAVNKETLLKRARLYPDVIHLHLDDARLCVNCDTIHSGSCCPTCASTNCLALSSVIGRMSHNLYAQRQAEQTRRYTKETAKITCGSAKSAQTQEVGWPHFLHLLSWLR